MGVVVVLQMTQVAVGQGRVLQGGPRPHTGDRCVPSAPLPLKNLQQDVEGGIPGSVQRHRQEIDETPLAFVEDFLGYLGGRSGSGVVGQGFPWLPFSFLALALA